MARQPEHLVEQQRTLGRYLAALREEAGLFQADIARAVPCHRTTVTHAEAGSQLPASDFWETADRLIGANGALIARYDELIQVKADYLADQQAKRRARAYTIVQQLTTAPPQRPERACREDSTGVLPPVEALEFTTVGGPFAFADLITPTQPTPVPSVVGQAEIAEVRNAAGEFSGWDALYGSGMVREAVVAQLRYCAELLNAHCSERVRADLFSAVGFLAHVTGFIAFDAYAHDDARRMFRFALYCAEESGDWHLRAKVLSSLARQAIWCGDPDAGLTFTELAMVRADRLTATERAMLHTGRSRALAKLGRVQDAAAAVGAADEEFSHSRPANDPVYIRYYDAAQHAGDTGHALWDVAVHGHFITEARHRLSMAVIGHGEEFARARAMSQIKLSSLVMVTGDPCEAALIGGQALDKASTIRSPTCGG